MRNVERAKQIAKSKGISFAFVCAQIGKSRSYLSEMLANNRDIPEKMLGPIANALGVTVEELMGEAPEQKEKPSTAGEIDLSGLSPEDAELIRKIMAASDAKKNAIRALL
jgi:transcriptional regulator with XRE-family HTH domain